MTPAATAAGAWSRKGSVSRARSAAPRVSVEKARTREEPTGVGEPTRRGQPTATTSPATTMTRTSRRRSPLAAAPASASPVATTPTATSGRGRLVADEGSAPWVRAAWARRDALVWGSEAEDITKGRVTGPDRIFWASWPDSSS